MTSIMIRIPGYEHPLHVLQWDPPYRVRVTSSKDPNETYAVDLVENGGLGKCDCPQFRMKLEPRYFTMMKIHPKLRCKHILAARECQAYMMLDRGIQIELQKDSNDQTKKTC